MRRRLLGLSVLVLCVSILLGAAGPAAAEEGDVFVGFGGNFAGEQFENAGPFAVDDSRTWTAQLGYRVNDHLAFELKYEQIDDFDLTDTQSFGFGTSVDFDGEASGFLAGVNAKLYPLQGGRLRPYLMAGVGYMKLDIDLDAAIDDPVFGRFEFDSVSNDEKAAVLQAGLGIDLQLSDSWFLELEGSYKFPQSDLEDFKFFVVGGSVQFRF